ncbi:MAG: hypothetical protein ACI8XB_002780 [Patiriisocius sp.]|jgi:hypothetical protein
MKKSIVLLLIASLSILGLEAKKKELPGIQPLNAAAQKLLEKAENCFPPTAYIVMDLNNVRYGMESGGLLWYDQTDALYEVPKGSGLHSMFAGGLWMGGRTPDGQLKLAGITYRAGGTDFWTGPLSIDNTASALNILCQEFDRHFRSRLVDVQLHNLWFERQECVAIGDCDESVLSEPPFEMGYSMPDYFNDWPGNNFTPNFNFTLAPFGERIGSSGENGVYDPSEGDYPGYDLAGEVDCRSRGPQDPIPLFGDETIWWVFNDNGGIHTETGDGEPIGMEIQAQSFVYSTTDEINNMSFYNYVLINRGVQTLENTFFGQYADSDVGFSEDDYVGCDVQRGLGYMYNGDDFDETSGGQNGYGANAPAIGIDFFEGPYLDPDGINNEISSDPSLWENENAIPYPGLGLGFANPLLENPDQIIDNERFGMSKFVYYDRLRAFPQTDPQNAIQFYNYLTGLWQNGAPFTYGGTGIGGTIGTDYVVPNDTDPLGYGTGGESQPAWSEETDANNPGDRRFLQSAGPFTLEPGEFNNITVGVVWTQAEGGVDELRNALFVADDKAQALFDNCFRILNGPGAPGVTVQELDQEIILYLSETVDSETYMEEDPSIPDGEDKNYVFEGYKVYQLASSSVSSADLGDPDKARRIRQVDVANGVGTLVNVVSTPDLELPVPTIMVNGADEGVAHSFRITQDVFTGGGLINHKTYYFMTVAYGYNEYAPYNQDGTGQDTPYLEGRLSYNSTSIPVVSGIPHKTQSEGNGSAISANYGELIAVTRLEGKGTGGNFLELTEASVNEIMDGAPWIADELDYEKSGSPVTVKVIDPLNVVKEEFEIRFTGEDPDDEAEIDPNDTRWIVTNLLGDTLAESSNTINVSEEFLLLDFGISIQIEQTELQDEDKPEFLGATMTFENSAVDWLTGVPDDDRSIEQNWIRAGTIAADCPTGVTLDTATPFDDCYYNDNGNGELDPQSEYESVLGGIVAPWILAGHHWSGPADLTTNLAPASVRFGELNNIDIIFTSDKSLWTRVPVLEVQPFIENTSGGYSTKGYPRVALSVDKNGKNILQGGNENEITFGGEQVVSDLLINEYMEDGSGNPGFSADVIENYKDLLFGVPDTTDEALYGHSFGYGWFPGYAYDVETGERLNMAFGENSLLGNQNGDDMIWNPTSTIWNENISNPEFNAANARFGGMHYIYVFRNESRRRQNNERVGTYDGANRIFKYIYGKPTGTRKSLMTAIAWTMLPLLDSDFSFLSPEQGLIPSKATIKLRVNKPYERFPTIGGVSDEQYLFEDGMFNYDDDDVDIYNEPDMADLSLNDWFPYYRFKIDSESTSLENAVVASDALELINVVPNPYYAFSFYENSRLDNRVKFINLPEECTIKIFNTAGTLVRTLGKDNPLTFLEWDLNNENNISIAGGAYIIHIEAPGIGSTVIKWFGVTRKLDLDNF